MVSEIIAFEIAVIVALVGTYMAMDRVGYTKVVKKMFIMFLVIMIIEFLTLPFWSNSSLDKWSYVYRDLSWILVILWVDISFISIMIVDRAWGTKHEKQRFWLYFLFISLFRIVLEWVLVKAGIRSYNDSLAGIFNGALIPGLELPFALLLVSAIIAIFIITLYKYTSEFLFKHLSF